MEYFPKFSGIFFQTCGGKKHNFRICMSANPVTWLDVEVDLVLKQLFCPSAWLLMIMKSFEMGFQRFEIFAPPFLPFAASICIYSLSNLPRAPEIKDLSAVMIFALGGQPNPILPHIALSVQYHSMVI